MPSINLRKPVYHELVRQDEDPTEYVNKVMQEHVNEKYGADIGVEADA